MWLVYCVREKVLRQAHQYCTASLIMASPALDLRHAGREGLELELTRLPTTGVLDETWSR